MQWINHKYCIYFYFSETTNSERSSDNTQDVFLSNFSDSTAELPEEWTDNGELCKTKCKKDGEAYPWCWKIGKSKSWDYCTPGKFHFKLFSLKSVI